MQQLGRARAHQVRAPGCLGAAGDHETPGVRVTSCSWGLPDTSKSPSPCWTPEVLPASVCRPGLAVCAKKCRPCPELRCLGCVQQGVAGSDGVVRTASTHVRSLLHLTPAHLLPSKQMGSRRRHPFLGDTLGPALLELRKLTSPSVAVGAEGASGDSGSWSGLAVPLLPALTPRPWTQS